MKILYLCKEHLVTPWYEDFFECVEGRWPVALYDPRQPAGIQFEDVGVVIDQGGVMGTPDLFRMAAESGVKLWQISGVGLDHVNVDGILEHGLLLANTPGLPSAVSLAEHALLLMLLCAKRYRSGQHDVAHRRYAQEMVEDLNGKTLGVVGLGASGSALARLGSIMDMHVLAIDVQAPPQAELNSLQVHFLGGADRLGDLVAQSDFVSLHTPLTGTTHQMIDESAIALMKPTAFLINIARGGLVDEGALIRALRAGRIAGAGLDVVALEPIDPSSPLLQFDNVYITPHSAAFSYGTSKRRARAMFANIERIEAGLAPLNAVTRKNHPMPSMTATLARVKTE